MTVEAIEIIAGVILSLAGGIFGANQTYALVTKIRAEAKKTREEARIIADDGDQKRVVTLDSLWSSFQRMEEKLTEEIEQRVYLELKFERSQRYIRKLEAILIERGIPIPQDTEPPLSPPPARRAGLSMRR